MEAIERLRKYVEGRTHGYRKSDIYIALEHIHKLEEENVGIEQKEKCMNCTTGMGFFREGDIQAEGISFMYCPQCGHPTKIGRRREKE